jgi:hypothetical protein
MYFDSSFCVANLHSTRLVPESTWFESRQPDFQHDLLSAFMQISRIFSAADTAL